MKNPSHALKNLRVNLVAKNDFDHGAHRKDEKANRRFPMPLLPLGTSIPPRDRARDPSILLRHLSFSQMLRHARRGFSEVMCRGFGEGEVGSVSRLVAKSAQVMQERELFTADDRGC